MLFHCTNDDHCKTVGFGKLITIKERVVKYKKITRKIEKHERNVFYLPIVLQ